MYEVTTHTDTYAIAECAGGGSHKLVHFMGPDAGARAAEYADWMNAKLAASVCPTKEEADPQKLGRQVIVIPFGRNAGTWERFVNETAPRLRWIREEDEAVVFEDPRRLVPCVGCRSGSCPDCGPSRSAVDDAATKLRSDPTRRVASLTLFRSIEGHIEDLIERKLRSTYLMKCDAVPMVAKCETCGHTLCTCDRG